MKRILNRVRAEPVVVRQALVSLILSLAAFTETVGVDLPVDGRAEDIAKWVVAVAVFMGSSVLTRRKVTPVAVQPVANVKEKEKWWA